MLTQRTRMQGGFSLVELMVGVVVGMIVVGAAGVVYVTTVRSSTDTLRITKLNQELRTMMDVMVSDIRRAGARDYVLADLDTDGDGTIDLEEWQAYAQSQNPFTVRDGANDTDITLLDGASCVLYAYDATYRGGTTETVDATDYFGFKLEGSNLRMLTSGVTTNDCATGTWETLNDNNTISIDTLTFYTTGSQCLNTTANSGVGLSWTITDATATVPACDCTDAAICPAYVAPTSGDVLIETRQVVIRLTGSHINDPESTLSLTEQVKLRNNRTLIAP